MRILRISRGWIIRESSLRMVLNKITSRDTFIPPPVLPAQAPTNISVTRIVWESAGHMSKSAVEYPVVVMIAPTWKKAFRSASLVFA